MYNYYPTAQTLYQAHIVPPDPTPVLPIHPPQHSSRSRNHRHHHQKGGGRGGSNSAINLGIGVGEANGPLEERILWSYVVQIANVMKEVHAQGLAFRTLDVTKVLVTGKNRCVFDSILRPARLMNVSLLVGQDTGELLWYL